MFVISYSQYSDSMSKAKLEHDIKTLEDKEQALASEKLEADKIVRAEMLNWNNAKDAKLKTLFRDMAANNITAAQRQIELYEDLLRQFSDIDKNHD